MTESPTAYDEVAYPGHVFPQSHPNRMATIAALHGMLVAPPERCRVLEVGCGAGDDLIALALIAPGSDFVGIDLARGGIERGQAVIKELGLGNVRLQRADLMEFVPDAQYDYIVAHGFLSWVPPPVQHRLLDLCHDALAPNGVAYISYNTFPGCHVRNMLRDMMRIHTAGISEPRQKIQQARGLVQFLRDGQIKSDEYAAFLRKEAEWILNRDSDALLFHDDLADVNIPFWFRDFAALASQHGMQFLAEADYFEMQVQAFPPATVEALQQAGDNVLVREQYLDFLKCRRFRQSLIVHEGMAINRRPAAETVRGMLVASAAAPESSQVDLSPQIVEKFTGRHGAVMQIDHPLTKAAMLTLHSAWPRPMTFAELISAARERLGPDSHEDDAVTLAEVLLAAYGTGLIELHSFRPNWATELSDRPTASPLVRLQLRQGRNLVSTLRPANRLIENRLDIALLQLLDGSRDRAKIDADLRREIESGRCELPAEFPIASLSAFIGEALRTALSEALLMA